MSPETVPLPPVARRRFRSLVVAGTLFLLAAALLGVSAGARPIPLGTVARILTGGHSSEDGTDALATIVLDLRLPRVALMALIGASLAVAGATYQGLFRNPLAEPYLVGVASGAGLGATLAITFGSVSSVGLYVVPLAAFLGGLATVTAVVLVAQVGRSTPVTTMLLAGVAIGSFTSAVTTFWMMRSPEGLQRAMNWILGGYAGGGWKSVLLVLPYFLVGLVAVQLCGRFLNVLQLDEDQARQLGVPVERLKVVVVSAATLMTAAAVSFGGMIAFVGLVVPHVLRFFAGPDYRSLIPLSALGGAAFLILADLAARTVFAPQELPVGVITALVGAPFFLLLLRQLKRSVF